MTNLEQIKNKIADTNAEEFVAFIYDNFVNTCKGCSHRDDYDFCKGCKKEIKEWLEKEAKND